MNNFSLLIFLTDSDFLLHHRNVCHFFVINFNFPFLPHFILKVEEEDIENGSNNYFPAINTDDIQKVRCKYLLLIVIYRDLITELSTF